MAEEMREHDASSVNDESSAPTRASRDPRVVRVADHAGRVCDVGLLKHAYAVHAQLRPHLCRENYASTMRGIFAEGAEMVACVDGADAVLGVAVFRVHRNSLNGRFMFVDDLVVAEAARSLGVGVPYSRSYRATIDGLGKALVAWLTAEAMRRGASCVALDSGTHRQQAHKFYFREGFTITSFYFRKELPKAAL